MEIERLGSRRDGIGKARGRERDNVHNDFMGESYALVFIARSVVTMERELF